MTFEIRRRSFLKGALGLAALGTVSGLAGKASAQTPAKGGKLVIGTQGQAGLGPIDPHMPSGDLSINLANQFNVFEALTKQSNSGEIEMCLAESVTPDDDTATVWTIRIKKGVLFHNGNELKADDVIFSIKRLRQPGTMTGGHIGPVKSYEKVDDHTVRLVLEAPRSWFPTGLSDPYSSILPVDFDPKTPVGTGPFKFGQIVQSQSVTFDRFDKYHGTPALLDHVVLRPFEDASAMLNALQSGQIDVINDVDASLVGEVEGDARFKVYNSPTGKFYPIQMRTDVAPFNDVRLRQALRLVIDREAVLNSVYNGNAEIANDLYGRYDPDFDKALKRERDIAKAKALVEEAGLAGTQLELVMYNDMATALVLADNAKEIGINITVKQLDGASFFNEEYMERHFFGGDYWPSGPIFLISSLADGPNAGLDQIRWRDPEYLELWKQASNTLDAAKRRDITMKLQEILFDRGGWIIPVFINELGLCRADIAGLPASDQSGAGIYRALPGLGFAA
jgi:peptide/nickel transport system substrate-binding protein